MNELLSALSKRTYLGRGHQSAHTVKPAGQSTGYQALITKAGRAGGRGEHSVMPAGHTRILASCIYLLPLICKTALTHSEKTVFWLKPAHIPYARALVRECGP